jgi:putative spermidine/putrescine transport system ATP-binding protein
MSALDAVSLRKVYGGRTVLADVSLSLREGEFVSLLGPSGCGKTTLLRLVAGFERPDAGQVLLDGRDITSVPAAKRNMGMVFQAYSLFPNMTAEENVGFGLRVRGEATEARRKRAREMLALVGLGEHMQKYPHQLSGGQQQRVALARALAIRPALLLLDEPLSALDAQVRVQLRDEIRRIQREIGIAALFVTHDQEEALSISDRVAVMQGGRIAQLGEPAAIYDEPESLFVARFVGQMAEFEAEIEDGGVRIAGHALPAERAAAHETGAKVRFFLRPEHVRLVEPGDGLPGMVESRTFHGPTTTFRIVLAGAGTVLATVPAALAHHAPGEAVGITWDPASPRILPHDEAPPAEHA